MGQLYSLFESQLRFSVPQASAQSNSDLNNGTWYCAPAESGWPYLFPQNQPWTLERQKGKKLCSNCLSLGQLPSEYWVSINNFRDIVVRHYSTVSTLLLSARGGCHLCCLLLVAWEQNCRLYQDPKGHWIGNLALQSVVLNDWIGLKFRRMKKTVQYTGVQVDEVQISIVCGNMSPEMGGQLICYPSNGGLYAPGKFPISDNCDLADFQILPKAAKPSIKDMSTGSKASMARIQAWLDICTSSHPECNRGDTLPPLLPTRVIAVGGKQSDKCFLVPGINKRGNYATLSHCWGNPNHRPLMTTEETLTLRQQGINDEELPKTFRDAVRVCRKLCIEYLWIDSLCIIQEQNSQEDWAEQAPKMGDVYGNSFLTISAAVAADSTEGCFRDRLGLTLWPCPVFLFGQQCYISRYPTEDEENGSDPGDLKQIPLLPLNNRTWAMQEQVLSRRSLIFTSNRLVWRCATMSTSEKYPLGIPHAPNISTDNHRLLHCIINGTIPVEQDKSDIDIYTCWYRMVTDVTSRELTYQDDKLPAIAGIAKRFAARANDSYHAGLWRGSLLVGILWHPTMYTPGKINRVPRAPTWSWASVNCPVSYSSLLSPGCDARRIPISPLLDIVDVSDPPISAEHPFGMTSKASLQLSGALLPVVRDEHEDSGLFLTEHGTRYAGDIENFLPDDYVLAPSAETPWYCLPVCVRHDSYYKGIACDPEPYQVSWKESLKTGSDEFSRFNRVFCLVLQVVQGQQDTYTRVGACIMNKKKGTEISRLSFRERKTLTII